MYKMIKMQFDIIFLSKNVKKSIFKVLKFLKFGESFHLTEYSFESIITLQKRTSVRAREEAMGSSKMLPQRREVSVICQHKTDGTIIPIKFKLEEKDGTVQMFKINKYSVVSTPGEYRMPNMVKINSKAWCFDCMITVLGSESNAKLYYYTDNLKWEAAF